MKKVVITTMTVLFSTIALAQRGNGERAQLRELSADQLASLHTKKMTLALDLDASQQTQMQAIHLEEAKRKKATMEARAERKEEGETGKRSPEERYQLKMQQLDHQIAHKAKVKEILTAEQYQRWERLMAKRAKHKKGKKRKHSK